MTTCTVIEAGVTAWRAARIDEDGFPVSLSHFDDPALHPVDGVFDARVTDLDSASDMAFFDLGGFTGVMNLRRAKVLADRKVDTIHDCLRVGQMVRVQVLAEPESSEGKSLTLTPRPRLQGRYVVVETGGARLSLSKDLKPHVSGRLKEELAPVAEGFAVIVRTRAGSVDPRYVVDEATYLAGHLTRPMRDKPGLVFILSEAERCLAALEESGGDILVEGIDTALSLKKLASERFPDLAPLVSQYKGTERVFEAYGVDEAIEEALAPRIDLPSGGWISITPTPALTAIDVNMGSALRGRPASEAKRLVNFEAAMAIAYHLRFQDIGGVVVVDFIDMSGKGAAADLMAVLDDALASDPVPVRHSGISNFGLMEFSRKRRGVSLRDRMMVTRPPVMRADQEAASLLNRALAMGAGGAVGNLHIHAPEPVVAALRSMPEQVRRVETRTSRTVTIAATGRTEIFLK